MMKDLLLLILVTGGLSIGDLKANDLSDSKNYKSRWKAVLKILHTQPVNWEEFEKGARALIKDFPTGPNGYEDMMILIEHHEHSNRKKARALAAELSAESTPEEYKLWAKGCLNRFDAANKPVTMRFAAVDGREVDLAKMQGKVVLVDFWSTRCGPCVEELPKIKAAYDKLHERGFEVIGISYDSDLKRLERFVKSQHIPWPQYNDGKQFAENKLAQEFGIEGIPHMFLLDKKGCLRFDNVRAKNDFEEIITKLLAEP